MTNDELTTFLQDWFNNLMQLREAKRSEYASSDSAFQNFEEASSLLHEKPQKVALYYMTKHIISIYDIYRNDESYNKKKHLLPEKINDAILYLLLMLAMER